MKLLTIAYLHFESYSDIEESLNYFYENIYKKLTFDEKSKINIIVSDNCSENSIKLNKIISNCKFVISLIKTNEYGMVDYNIFNIIENTRTKYLWIFSSDDCITSYSHLKYIMNYLELKKPDIFIGLVSLEKDDFIEPREIFISNDVESAFNLLFSAGKISCAIYNTKFNNVNLFKKLKNYIGFGYLHISYGAFIYERGLLPIVKIDSNIVFTNHIKNYKNNYHPKFSQTIEQAINTELFFKNVKKLRYKLKYNLNIKIYWIVNLVIKNNIKKWDNDLLKDYINETAYIFNKSKKSIKCYFLMTAALFLLILSLNINLLFSAINGLLGKRMPIKYMYTHGNRKV